MQFTPGAAGGAAPSYRLSPKSTRKLKALGSSSNTNANNGSSAAAGGARAAGRGADAKNDSTSASSGLAHDVVPLPKWMFADAPTPLDNNDVAVCSAACCASVAPRRCATA